MQMLKTNMIHIATCRRTMALILYQLKLPPKLEFFFWQIKRRFWQLLKFGSKIKTNLHYKNDSQTTFKIQEEINECPTR